MKLLFKNIISATFLGLFLTACGIGDITPVDNRTIAQKQRDENGSFFGLSDMLGSNKKVKTGTTIGVNVYLWRGALDTLSVNPLGKIDVKNGVIQTEWIAVSSKQQVRISAIIISSDLKVNGLRVNVYKRVKEDGAWVNLSVGKATVSKITDAILQRAKELRLAEKS